MDIQDAHRDNHSHHVLLNTLFVPRRRVIVQIRIHDTGPYTLVEQRWRVRGYLTPTAPVETTHESQTSQLCESRTIGKARYAAPLTSTLRPICRSRSATRSTWGRSRGATRRRSSSSGFPSSSPRPSCQAPPRRTGARAPWPP